MRILLVSATQKELEPLLDKLNISSQKSFTHSGNEIDILISGVGMLSTSYQLSKKLSIEKYDLILNIGTCGAFHKHFQLGEVLMIDSDLAVEEGAEDGDQWIGLEAMGLRAANDPPYLNGTLTATLSEQRKELIPFKKVKAISVNRVLGNESTIRKMLAYAQPEVESMEGAAVYYCCSMEKLECVQIRAVSNYVENRNKESWEIELALANLADATLKFIENV